MAEDLLAPEEALAALRHCYNVYISRFIAVNGEEGFGGAIADFFGGRVRKKGREETLIAFHQAAADWVEQLSAGLADCTPVEAAPYAASGVETILLYPVQSGRALDLALAALEGLAEPLLPYVAKDGLAELVARYRKRTPPRMMLPNQRALFQKMEALLL